jgi:hypothetical protein
VQAGKERQREAVVPAKNARSDAVQGKPTMHVTWKNTSTLSKWKFAGSAIEASSGDASVFALLYCAHELEASFIVNERMSKRRISSIAPQASSYVS